MLREMTNYDPPYAKETATLLLVEDEPLGRMSMEYLLQHSGYRVVSVENGFQALDALSAQGFDVILLDIQLPGMDGIQVLEQIRNHRGQSFDPDISVIALTGFNGREERKHLLNRGFNGHVAKPPRLDELIKQIEAVVSPVPETSKKEVDEEPACLYNRCLKDIQVFIDDNREDRLFLTRMTEGFVGAVSVKMKQIYESISASDFDLAGGLAHSLLAVVGAVELISLADKIRELEGAIREEDFQKAISAHYLVKNAVERVVDYLKENGSVTA